MLRITTIDNDPVTTFRLEGRLAGDWVAELERCFTSIKAADPSRKVEIDMSDLDFVDAKGELLLERLLLSGAKLHGSNLFIMSIVAGIVEH